MDFLTSDRSTFSRQARLATNRKKGNEGLFVWAAVIVILTAVCTFSWTFCMYVFGHPEKAFNYNLLTDMEKLAPLKDYQPSTAPRGKFHTPRDLYKLYFNHDKRSLRSLSAVLRRQYITNFLGVERVTYIRGDYLIYSITPLSKSDVFPSGLALRGQAEDYPNVIIEYILPADQLPEAHYDLKVNKLLEVGTSSTCAAVINVSRVDEDKLCFTAIPIVYGAHTTPSETTVSLRPPDKLNLYGKLPITAEPVSAPGVAAAAPREAASGG